MTQSNTTSPHAPTMTVAEKAQILDQIAANLPLLINVNNLSLGQFTFVSPAWEDLTGLPVKVWLERPDAWQDIVHPDDRDATIDLAEAGKKRAMRARATRILHQDGTVHTIHGWTFPVYDADGNISLVVGVAEDISAWKATERELRARQVELEQQLRARTIEAQRASDALDDANRQLGRNLELVAAGLKRHSQLTPREREVMGLLVRGKSNREAGEVLGITVNTVKIHRARLMAKMEVGNLPELVAFSVRAGLL